MYTQANGGTGAIAPEHAAAGSIFFFFGPRKRGVRPHPPNPPWLRACSLASQATTKSAASIRRRRQLREDLESSRRKEQLIAAQQQLIAAQLAEHQESDAIRRALRNEENLADNDDAISSRLHPSSTASISAWMEQHPSQYQAIPDSTPFAVPGVAQEALQNSGTTPTTTIHVSADLPRSPVPASARDQPGAENETGPVPPHEIAPASGAIESTTMEQPQPLPPANVQVSEPTHVHVPTSSHLLDLTIDQPTQHSTQNSSSALPPPPPLLSSTVPPATSLHDSGRVSPTLSSISSQSSLGVPSLAQTAQHTTRTQAPPPPAWPAPTLLPVVDIPPPPPPMHHHSVTFGQPTTASHMHPPTAQHGPSSE